MCKYLYILINIIAVYYFIILYRHKHCEVTMKESKDIIKEYLAVLYVLAKYTSEQDTNLKHIDYINYCYSLFNIKIERRKLSNILDDLYSISNDNEDLLPFRIELNNVGNLKAYKYYKVANSPFDFKSISTIIKCLNDNGSYGTHKIVSDLKKLLTRNELNKLKSYRSSLPKTTYVENEKIEELLEYSKLQEDGKLHEIELTIDVESIFDHLYVYNAKGKDLDTLINDDKVHGYVYDVLDIDGVYYLALNVNKYASNFTGLAIMLPIYALKSFRDFGADDFRSVAQSYKIDDPDSLYSNIGEWVNSFRNKDREMRVTIGIKKDRYFANYILEQYVHREFEDFNLESDTNGFTFLVSDIRTTRKEFLKWFFSNEVIYKNVIVIEPNSLIKEIKSNIEEMLLNYR